MLVSHRSFDGASGRHSKKRQRGGKSRRGGGVEFDMKSQLHTRPRRGPARLQHVHALTQEYTHRESRGRAGRNSFDNI